MEALIAMPRSQDVAALVDAHHRTVWRYLRYLGCEPAVADDLTQETFLRVLERPFEERSRNETAAYLRTVARHLFLDQVRRSKLIRTVEDIDQADAAWERAGADDSDARQRALEECLEALEGKARRVLTLQFRERRSGAQIAKALRISAANVRVIAHRARAALKACIAGKMRERGA